MKRIIFLLLIIVSNVISYDGVITKEDMEWRINITKGLHGDKKPEWTKKVIMLNECRKNELEIKLDSIATISLNILNKKPEEWLNGKYLEYVNRNCKIWAPLRGTEKEFDKIVDDFLNSSLENNIKKDNPNREIFLVFFIAVLLIVFYLIRERLWERQK